MVQLQRDVENGRLYLLDPDRKTRIVWSLDSGLIETYEREGNVIIGGNSERMGLQLFVTVDGVPALRGREFSNNPFLPAALPETTDVTGTGARLSFIYRTTVPMLPDVPAVTLRAVYNYDTDDGLHVFLQADADGYRSAWSDELKLELVLSAKDVVPIKVLEDPDEVGLREVEDTVRSLYVTCSVRHGTVSLCVGIGSQAADVRDDSCHFEDGFEVYPVVLRDYARLLLTSFDGMGRLITGYNVVEPQGYHYFGIDRDDVVAEMIAIACRYNQRFEDGRFLNFAERLAELLIEHIQPDGGLTFGMQVNGVNVDYSDTDADAIDAFVQLYERTGNHRYLEHAFGILQFMLRFQDASGFFWGRRERNESRLRFRNQPWFTAYATVAMQQLLPYVVQEPVIAGAKQKHQGPAYEELKAGSIGVHADLLTERITRAIQWLEDQQRSDGSWPHDTEGPYADYDDLTNTSVAVWCLGVVDRVRNTFDHADAILSGLEYLVSLERPDAPGQYAGRFTPNVEVLIYDYKLGFALREGVHYLRRLYGRDDERAKEFENRYLRYLRHLAAIQGKKGMIEGAWGSVYDIQTQKYKMSYRWYERHSSWQQYAFLGWQGKLIELFLDPFLNLD